jgi:hypothetical protein
MKPPHMTPDGGHGLAMARLAFGTWATQVVVAQRLSEAAWQPFARQAARPDGADVG